jgi:hypothetical protein
MQELVKREIYEKNILLKCLCSEKFSVLCDVMKSCALLVKVEEIIL